MSVVTNPILVAFDGTEPADAVLDEAVELARRCGTTLVLMRTVPVVAIYAPSAMLGAASHLTAHEEAAERDLRALAEQVPPDLLADAIVRLGTPWEAICQVATDRQASLIVIGFTPTGRFRRRAGATSLRVVGSAPCPVVVVRDRAHHAAAA